MNPAAPPDDSVAPTVWLVDDSPLQRELARQILAERHTIVVFDGAAPMLERLSVGERPDVLVLDWHMPEISGLEACRQIRTIADGGELPVIVLTATSGRQDLLDALAAGANDFISKPAGDAELNARVAGLVRMKRLHARLAATESALRDEATFRERFLAILAHDLRQPLGVFALGSEVLADSATPQAVRNGVKSLFAKANGRMERMIGELLDFSRSRPQGGGMHVAPRAMDLAAVVRDVVDEVRLAHPKRKITVDVAPHCMGEWDADRLSQVVGNLVENALAHSTPESPVRVAMIAAADGIHITVDNDGEPLDPDLLATIFDPFRRGSSRDAGDRGLGLGLYIVHQIVRAHGGTVAARSDQGTTRFLVRLPCSRPMTTTGELKAAPRILVVDDGDDARALCMAFLAHEGFRVEGAADGLEALEKVANAPPDLIFMDLLMPRMDGWEATRLIKSDPRTSGIVVIVLTGEAAPAALQRARAAGASHVSRRPVSAREMLALIQRHLDAAA